MKLKILSLLIFFISSTLYAQVPAYYNDVNLNQTGQDLKDELAVKIIATHATFLSYTPGVWDALQQADLDPSNSNNVLLIYGYNDTDGDPKTDRTRGKFDNGGNTGLWNREHSYPKSLGNPNLGTSGPGSDAHHLRASDVQMNSTRSNRIFADGNGNAGITAQGHFYPGDEWKGDVARMMMFMYLRYGTQCLPNNVGDGNAVAGDANMIDLFLQWNAQDPVNQFEDNRNTIIEGIQGNRNPFIDNPALATQIWGGPQAEDRFGTGTSDTEAPSVPTNLIAQNTTATSTVLSWSASTDNIGVTGYNIYQNSTLLTTTGNTTFNSSGLVENTSYSFYIVAKDAAGNVSGNSTVLNITTPNSGGGSSSDLFISEYIEGSSNNKAIEVANFTGNTINLSGYSLRKQTNGAGSWSSGYNLSGTINNGNVFVVANSSASSQVTANANATSGNSSFTFNGNDPVGLFKNGQLIDIIGVFNGGSSNFAKDVTLRRKSTILNPNTTYITSEWDSFSQNTFDNLGSHTVYGDTTTDTQAPSIPANLIASNTTETSTQLSWGASTDNVGVTGYNVYQDGNLITTIASTAYTVNGLIASTTYNFTVSAKDEAGNISAASNTVSITTDTIVLTYCDSKGNNTNYEYIDFVGLGGINNTTAANGGYADFTNLIGNVVYGTNTIILSVGFSGSSYTENWKVWIDFNQNGTFETSEELVTGSTSSTGNLSYNFNVPNTALSGNTRMRISMKWNGDPTACETFSYGEVEDYTVNIGGASRNASIVNVKIDGVLTNSTSVFDAKVYSVFDALYIDMKDSRTVSYVLTNLRGQMIATGKFSKHLNLSGLDSGTYVVNIMDGQRTIFKKFLMK